MDDVVTAQEMLEMIQREHPLQSVDPNYSGEVARRWALADGSAEIGVIASVTQAFCGDCSRIRLSTDGKLYTCLFASDGTDVRTPLRQGADDAALDRLIATTWQRRSDRYSQIRNAATERPLRRIEMSYIGG